MGAAPLTVWALLFLFVFARVFSQTVTASASGVCHDDQGAVLSGVSIVIKNVETGIRRVTVTDSTGRYYLALLSPGTYEIQASMTGFRTEVRKDLTLTSGQEAVVGFVLHVGQIEERSEVAAEAGLTDTITPALSEIVDQRKVRDLPLNGRDIVQLIQLQPGVNVARSDGGDILTGGEGTRITVAGVRPSGNVFMLDGTIINNLANRVATGAPGNYRRRYVRSSGSDQQYSSVQPVFEARSHHHQIWNQFISRSCSSLFATIALTPETSSTWTSLSSNETSSGSRLADPSSRIAASFSRAMRA